MSKAETQPKPAKTRAGAGGPRTLEGRRRSSRNAVRHGLMSQTLVLDTEDERAFNHLRAAYLETFQPVGFLELELLDEMVAAKWRQRRVWSTETAAINFELAIQADEDYECALDLDGPTRTARAVCAMDDDSEDLAKYRRYETRFHRMYKPRAEAAPRDPGPPPAVVPVSPRPGSSISLSPMASPLSSPKPRRPPHCLCRTIHLLRKAAA